MSAVMRLARRKSLLKPKLFRHLSSAPQEVLWKPSPDNIAKSNLTAFSKAVESKYGLAFNGDYENIWRWSVDHPGQFWGSFWDYSGILHSEPYTSVVDDANKMPGAAWFQGARLNFAENLLKHKHSNSPAYVFYAESTPTSPVSPSSLDTAGSKPFVLSHRALHRRVAIVAKALREAGVVSGDRVVGLLPNTPDAAVCMLAATSLGAAWASCSPDFGDKAVLDRFAQVRPKVLFCCDHYFYKGKRHDTVKRLPHLVEGLRPSLERAVLVPSLPRGMDSSSDDASAAAAVSDLLLEHTGGLGQSLDAFVGSEFLLDQDPALCAGPPLEFEQVPFEHPVYVMFSSGTTGLPKCMVQGCGVLLKHMVEIDLLCDLKPNENMFFYTTTGWMMWNWLTSTLATGATIVAYEGDPMYPHPDKLWTLADHADVHVFGTSARYLSAQLTAGVVPKESADLKRSLRSLLSTGSPAAGNVFEFTRDKVGSHVAFGSMSGGTDLNGCFAGPAPTKSVVNGELQARALGMAVRILGDDGAEVEVGATGELCCDKAFPSMPLYFWDDVDGSKYREAYFEEFQGVWRHGDFAEVTPSFGLKIHGRSDATLNPGGVRIGTADLYRCVEEDLLDDAVDSLIVGEDFVLPDGTPDVRIVLFLQLRAATDQEEVDMEALAAKAKSAIRRRCSPRHVPAKVVACPDIPCTANGKKVEIAVKKVMSGKPVTNLSVLRNPEALEWFRVWAENEREREKAMK